MGERHQTRGKQVLTTGGLVVGLCVAALLVPSEWVEGVGRLLGSESRASSAFADEVARADAALQSGTERPSPEIVGLVAARRLTRAGPMTSEEVADAARIWRETTDTDELVDRLARSFPRLDRSKIEAEVARLREQLLRTPGGRPAVDCVDCHRETIALPEGHRFDVPGIYPFAADAPEFADGRRVPVLAEAIELGALRQTSERHGCQDCHAPHGASDFHIDRPERIRNMGLWVTALPAADNVVHVQVKVRNARSGHRAPAGRVAPAYVVTVQARQHRQPLKLRYGTRLPQALRREGSDAGVVFGRDFRDARGQRTAEVSAIVDLVADTRLESGRFQQSDFLFDRIDDSIAQLDVVLWHLPDVTTWKGAKAIRKADKPERSR